MKVLAALDSFKGCMTSLQAAEAAAAGIHAADSDIEVIIKPLADGGEGTLDALLEGTHGRRICMHVQGPLGTAVTASYGIIEKTGTAVIEAAQAVGLNLISSSERNPLLASTYGLGELIREAAEKGCRHFIVGIGGSCTNDGGKGMLEALGYRFLNKEGNPTAAGAAGLKEVSAIDDTRTLPILKDCDFRIACDVDNPLCGERGCSAVFGGQKGADKAMIAEMDSSLKQYADAVQEKYSAADQRRAGAGAAGGLGFAFDSFLHGSLESGTAIVADALHMEEAVRGCDFVVTGEGRIDGQTAMGKAPSGIARLAEKYEKPVIVFAGSEGDNAENCLQNGITAWFPIQREPVSLENAMDTQYAEKCLSRTAEQVFRMIEAVNGKCGRIS